MIYTVSYMVQGEVRGKKFTGLTRDEEKAPVVGGKVEMEGNIFEITHVEELIPPIGGFCILHATCQWVPDDKVDA